MPPFYQPELVGSISRQGSKIYLPAIRIGKRAAIIYAAIIIISIFVAGDTLRTFIISERALLTSRGRENYRTRRRTYHKSKKCDETDEPKLWKTLLFHSGWRSLSSCVEYDLSLRRHPLGDKGVRRLVFLLGRKEYATRQFRGVRQLRVLNLERQGITRRGAGYLARWLSVDPVKATNDTADLVDVDRMPTAAFRSIYINLEGNPIGLLGVKDLERAVDKARMNGIRVVIVGGGSFSDDVLGGRSGRHPTGAVGHEHVVKLGPIEYTRKSVEMPPWRLPVPILQKLNAGVRAHRFLPLFMVVLVFCVGAAFGRTTSAITFPYRLVVVRSD